MYRHLSPKLGSHHPSPSGVRALSPPRPCGLAGAGTGSGGASTSPRGSARREGTATTRASRASRTPFGPVQSGRFPSAPQQRRDDWPYSDENVANRTGRVSGGRSLTRPFRHARRLPTTRLKHVARVHVRRESLGFVPRSRTILCRAVPNLDLVTIRNFVLRSRAAAPRRGDTRVGGSDAHCVSHYPSIRRLRA